jgi:hypothetical protein
MFVLLFHPSTPLSCSCIYNVHMINFLCSTLVLLSYPFRIFKSLLFVDQIASLWLHFNPRKSITMSNVFYEKLEIGHLFHCACFGICNTPTYTQPFWDGIKFPNCSMTTFINNISYVVCQTTVKYNLRFNYINLHLTHKVFLGTSSNLVMCC